MSTSLTKLIPAIVTYVTERDSYVSKTKLLKLLYLFDVEWYRNHRQTYTGFDWKFFHLGPWTAEYDPLLKEMAENLLIRIQKSQNPSFDTEFLKPTTATDFSDLFESYKEEFILRGVLSTWGEKSTAEILDYVYFWTEPMKNAERYKRLDFSEVTEQPPPRYVRERSSSTTEELEEARTRILQAAGKLKGRAERTPFPEQRYDAEYFDAIEKLEA